MTYAGAHENDFAALGEGSAFGRCPTGRARQQHIRRARRGSIAADRAEHARAPGGGPGVALSFGALCNISLWINGWQVQTTVPNEIGSVPMVGALWQTAVADTHLGR